MNTQLLFELAMIAQVAVGFVCAYRLGPQVRFVMRLMILSPCLMALFSLFGAVSGDAIAYKEDVTYAIANIIIYIILASLLSTNKWCVKNESSINH